MIKDVPFSFNKHIPTLIHATETTKNIRKTNPNWKLCFVFLNFHKGADQGGLASSMCRYF